MFKCFTKIPISLLIVIFCFALAAAAQEPKEIPFDIESIDACFMHNVEAYQYCYHFPKINCAEYSPDYIKSNVVTKDGRNAECCCLRVSIEELGQFEEDRTQDKPNLGIAGAEIEKRSSYCDYHSIESYDKCYEIADINSCVSLNPQSLQDKIVDTIITDGLEINCCCYRSSK